MCGRNDDKMQQRVDATMKHAVGALVLELKLADHMKQCVLYELHLCISQFISETETGTMVNVLWTVHRDIFVQYEPTRCTIYSQFILIINLYTF